jgi:hypothetical protein
MTQIKINNTILKITITTKIEINKEEIFTKKEVLIKIIEMNLQSQCL